MKYILPLACILLLTGCSQTNPSNYENLPQPLLKGGEHIQQESDQLSEEEFEKMDAAEQILRNDPEIKTWLALFDGPDNTSKNNGRAAILQLGIRDNGEVEFKLYESLPGHNATYGWYCVDIETEVVRECSLD